MNAGQAACFIRGGYRKATARGLRQEHPESTMDRTRGLRQLVSDVPVASNVNANQFTSAISAGSIAKPMCEVCASTGSNVRWILGNQRLKRQRTSDFLHLLLTIFTVRLWLREPLPYEYVPCNDCRLQSNRRFRGSDLLGVLPSHGASNDHASPKKPLMKRYRIVWFPEFRFQTSSLPWLGISRYGSKIKE